MAHHLCIIICVNFPSILSFLSPNESHEDSVLIGIIVFVVFGLPAVIIHVNYYLVNKDDILKYSDEHRKIVIIHKGVTTTFSLDDNCKNCSETILEKPCSWTQQRPVRSQNPM